ncbi:hypothetical protein [Arhodomonas sp. SL1]|uniref:hypothetical protein n=1 Tax=Arhodomonas sp. SL1 TaxID=3425691 RepID=UPI003F883F90
MAQGALASAAGAFQQGYRFHQDMRDRERKREANQEDRQWLREKRRMERRRFDTTMDQVERERNQQQLQQTWGGIAHALENGQAPDPQLLEQANELSDGQVMRAFRNVWSPGKRQAIDVLKGGIQGEVNDPKQIANAANLVLQPELSEGVGESFQGEDGKEWTIRRKFVQGVVPSPGGDGVMLDLAVEAVDDEGNRKVYGAPATDGRSAGGEDNMVRNIPLDDVVKKLRGMDNLAAMVESNDQLRGQLEQMAISQGVDPEVFTGNEGEFSYEEFKSGDQIETWVLGPGGEPVRRISTAPRWKPSKPTAKEEEVQNLVDRGVPEEWATDVANGNVTTEMDDFGNVIATNRATGEVRNLGRPGQEGDQRGAEGSGQGGGRSALESSGQGQPTGAAQQPRGQGDDASVFADVAEGTGPLSNIRSAISGVVGPFVDGALFPDTERARSALRNFNQTAKQALVNSNRFPVYEQKIVAELLPDPNQFFNDPDAARERLLELRDFLERKRQRNQESVEAGNITSKRRAALADQNDVLESVIDLMGSPEGGGPQGGSQAGARNGQRGGADVPISQMSVDQLDALDPSQLSDQELIEASRRYRQIRGGE